MNSLRHESSQAIVSQTLRVIATTCILGVYAFASSHKAPPIKPANQYAAFDTHPNEHVTIGIDPCNDPEKCSFFRLPYIQHGFIPVRVVITNDGDTALTLTDVRIQFISAANDKIPAADLELFGGKGLAKYHALGCRFGERIQKGDRVFFNSADVARQAGRVPCSICLPGATQHASSR